MSICHSGFHAASGLLAAQVAKPSFSQMSSHHFIVTRFAEPLVGDLVGDDRRPPPCSVSTEPVASSASSSRSRKVMAPAFSIAPAAKSGMPMMSSLPNGYGMPK